MLSGEASIAQDTISDIQAIEGLDELMIYRIDGTSAFHDNATLDKVNDFLGGTVFYSSPRVELRNIESPFFEEALTTQSPVNLESTALRQIEYFFPIRNFQECQVCHGSTSDVQGVIHFKVSTEDIYARINTATILRSGPQAFLDFAEEADGVLRRIDENLELSGDGPTIDALFRDLHSLKGSARYLEFKGLATMLHEAEETVAGIRDGERSPGPGIREDMSRHLEALYDAIDKNNKREIS